MQGFCGHLGVTGSTLTHEPSMHENPSRHITPAQKSITVDIHFPARHTCSYSQTIPSHSGSLTGSSCGRGRHFPSTQTVTPGHTIVRQGRSILISD